VRELLDSICRQARPCGRIVIVDGGESIAAVIAEYEGRLPVEHHLCHPPGQIRQRNMGIALLDERTPLVACLDDDIVLEPGALDAMIAFWNQCDADTAAVGFNVINNGREPRNWLRGLVGLSGPEPGRVLSSGFTTASSPADRDIRVDWVPGGATVWRLDLLKSNVHRPLPGKWAIGEDVIFSYPIGRERPLFVCAAAKVRHEHVFDYRVKRPQRFHGYTQTIWVFYLVEANHTLSRARFLWSIVATAAARLAAGIARPQHAAFAVGQLQAISRGLLAIARGRDIAYVIEQDARG
jgi:glycosyltransferase involved in cell wall biosynthesis